MYNSDIPTRAELPTSRQLIRSTIIALLSASAILVTIVLPAEYAIDPTGIGRLLGLAEMGEIKAQLADEAEEDRVRDQPGAVPAAPAGIRSRLGLFDGIAVLLLISPAAAQSAPAGRTDEVVVTLNRVKVRKSSLS